MDIVGKRRWFLLTSAIYCIIAIIFIAVFGLKRGVVFSSGSVLTLNFEKKVEQSVLEEALKSAGYQSVIQLTGGGDFIIRTHLLTSEGKTRLESTLLSQFGKVNEVEFDYVAPMVAAETTRNAAIAVIAASFGILLYIAWAFRRMPSPFLCGLSAVLTLAHDTLVSVGLFAVLGRAFNWEIDLTFVMGILAVIGYSVNSTVVVFDCIREELLRSQGGDFASTVNDSLLRTLGRSLNTSLTTLITALAIFLFVGIAIRNFSVVFMAGLIAGTYSSTLIAPLLLVSWGRSKEIKQEA